MTVMWGDMGIFDQIMSKNKKKNKCIPKAQLLTRSCCQTRRELHKYLLSIFRWEITRRGLCQPEQEQNQLFTSYLSICNSNDIQAPSFRLQHLYGEKVWYESSSPNERQSHVMTYQWTAIKNQSIKSISYPECKYENHPYLFLFHYYQKQKNLSSPLFSFFLPCRCLLLSPLEPTPGGTHPWWNPLPSTGPTTTLLESTQRPVRKELEISLSVSDRSPRSRTLSTRTHDRLGSWLIKD